MKVKFLLSALTMPMIFAACTNDELMDNQASVSLNNRTPLGDVELTFGNLDSRLALQDGSWYAFDWANGDDLGASLIDVRNATAYDEDTNPIEYYNLTTTPQTNYRYEYKDGSWTSNAAMVEGNYVFYMPYVENTSRQATLAVLPSTQKLEKVTVAGEETYTTYNSVLEDAKENGHVMAVGYKFLSAAGENEDGNKTISVSFKQLYATPLITIQNWAQGVDGEMTDLTINKIKLSLTKKSDNTKRYFRVKDYLKYTANTGTATAEAWTKDNNSIVDCLNGVLNPDDDDYIGGSWNNLNLNKTKRTTAQLLQGSYADSDGTQFAETITINIEDSITIASKASFSFYAVIPGGAYTDADTDLGQLVVTLVTTDNEQVSVELPEVNINPGKRYAVEAYASDTEVGTGAAALTAVTTMQLTPAPVETGVEITTQEELYTAIATAKKVDLTDDGQNNPTKVDMEFIVNGDITLNDQVITMMQSKTDIINSVTFKSKDVAISALSKTVNIPITIKKNVSISGSVNADLLNTTTATDNKIKVEGNVTIASGAAAILSGEIKKITNNGTLTLDDATSTLNDVTNNGTLNLKANLNAGTKNITNAANATINVKATSTVTAKKLTNKGTLNIVKTDSETGALIISAEIENQKTIAVAGTMTASGKFTNKANATINVTGTLTASGAFTNSGDVTIAEGATMTATGASSINFNKIDVTGTLDINANADTITLSNSSKFGTNKVTVRNTAYDSNSKVIWGTILNANGKTVDATTLAGTTGQRVWKSYDALTGEQDWEVATTYNAVKYNGATIAAESAETVVPCKLVYAEFNGNSTLVVTGEKNVGMPQIIQVNQELAVEGASTLVMPSTGAAINIAKNATLGWNDNVNIKSDGAILITNKGKVYCNAGSVTDVDAASTGVWATGTTGQATGWIGVAATAN